MDLISISKTGNLLRKYVVIFLTSIFLLAFSNVSYSAPTKKIQFKKSQAQQVIFNKLKNRVQTHGSTRVIVELNVQEQPASLNRAFRLSQRQLIKSSRELILQRVRPARNGRVKEYKHVPYISMEVDEANLDVMLLDPDIKAVYEDTLKKALLAQSSPLIGATSVCTDSYCGEGQTIAILDSGVDSNHSFLNTKVVHEACFSTTDSSVFATTLCPNGQEVQISNNAGTSCSSSIDGCEHGTHVAGIVAGKGASSGVGFSGVAPEANIMSVQVFSRFNNPVCSALEINNPCIFAFTSDIISALEHVYDQRNNYDIAAVNMSLGGGLFSSACDSEPEKATIDLLKSVGIATVVASGNDNSSTSIASPACISSAISVGSTTKLDVVSNFSNSTNFLDLLAPGENVFSSLPSDSFGSLSGTSQATPHISGAIAVLRSANPFASVDEMLTTLKNTGVAVTDNRNGLTKPRIQMDLAINDILVVHIDNPPDGAVFNTADTIPFSGTANDFEDGNISGSIVWSSDLDGVLGSGASINISTLSVGLHTISANVIDSDNNSFTATKQVRVTVVDTNPPTTNNDSITLEKGKSAIIAVTSNDTDGESGLNVNSIVLSNPTNGTLIDNGDGSITYTHDGSETSSDSFTYTIADYAGNVSSLAVVNITITSVNDAPTIITNEPLNVVQGESEIITTSQLLGSDVDDSAAEINFNITTAPLKGQLEYNDNPGIAISNFTQADININRVKYVHDGSPPVAGSGFPAEFELSSLLATNGGDGSEGFVLNGKNANEYSGFTVSDAGDINGDGYADIIIGAYEAAPNGDKSGESYVVFGRANGFSAEFELSSLLATNGGDGSEGFVLNGIDAFDRSGNAVAGAGDVNDDGYDDLIIGTKNGDPNGNQSGETYVVFGKGSSFTAEFELSSLLVSNGGDGTAGFYLYGINAYDYSGHSVASAGDVNGDGYADILIGAHNAAPNNDGAGQAYVVFGKASGFSARIELSSLVAGDGSTGFVLNGFYLHGHTGISLSTAGDINGDGYDDLLIGADSANPNGNSSGQSYVIFGQSSGFPAVIELSSLLIANGGDGSNGFVINGINTFEYSGHLSSAGDVNGDGLSDILIGAYGAQPNGSASGQSYVVYGKTSGFPVEFELSSLLVANGGDGSNGFVLNGSELDRSGFSVSNVGDVNGDGLSDILIGAYFSSPNGDKSGRSYVIFANSSGFPAEFELSTLLSANGGDGSAGFVLNGINTDDSSGYDVSSAGDINGDGFADLLIGAYQADPNGESSGQSYIVFGRNSSGFADSFAFSLADGGEDGALPVTGVFNIIVNAFAENIPPTVVNDSATLSEGASVTIPITSNDSDAGSGLDLTSLVLTNPTYGTLIDNDDGSITYTHGGSEGSSDSFNYTIADYAGNVSSLAVVTITINPINDEPDITTNNLLSVYKGSDKVITTSHLVGSDADDVASEINYTITTAPIKGQLEFSDNPGVVISSFTQADIDTNRVVYVHDDSTLTTVLQGFPAEIELSTLSVENCANGSDGFVINGIDVGDNNGRHVSGAGDVNGDGYDDLMMSAIYADPNGASSGEIYVVYGQRQCFPSYFELSTLLEANGGDGSLGFILKGIDASDRTGSSISNAGDINGDGYADLLIGANYAGTNGQYAGESYVIFGEATGIPAEIEISSLLGANGGDGSTGFVLNGISADDYSGYSVSNAGDVNGDGFGDILISSPYADPNGSLSGVSYIIFGKATNFSAEFELSSLLAANGGNGSAGFIINGTDVFDYSGYSVSTAGDVNGDGYSDLLIGAYGADPNGDRSGESYIVFGKATGFGATFELSSLLAANGGNGSAGFVLNGINVSDRSGYSVSSAGDVNGDSYSDILIGAYQAAPNGATSGESYIVFGKATAFQAEFELSSLLSANGSTGFVLNGVNASDRSGSSVSSAGDVNGDGYADILIGAYYADPNGKNFSGQSYVIFGKASGYSNEFELSTLRAINGGDGSAGFTLNGINSDDRSGYSVSDAGDINGDGYDDIILGSYNTGVNNTGESYVVFGQPNFSDSFLFSLSDGGEDGAQAVAGQFKIEISIPVDTDGDGVPDKEDAFPNDSNETLDTDSDGIGNNADDDDDGDGVLDVNDDFPLDPNEDTDTDSDGVGDNADTAFDIPNGNIAILTASINAANDEVNNPGIDTINLAINGTYLLSLVVDTSVGNTGLPVINTEIVINGNDASILGSTDNNPCDGVGSESRILLVNASGNLTLNNTTISNGCVFDSGGGGDEISGGGIAVIGGILSLNNSVISNNISQFLGGGIYSNAGTITIENSEVLNNSSQNWAAGIMNFNNGELIINNSSITNNSAAGNAGGIDNSSSTVTINNSTVSSNSTGPGFHGGGIYSTSGTLTLFNSTVYGNSATYGAGISTFGLDTFIINSTITENVATSQGAGIYITGPNNFVLKNSLVANNTISNSTSSNCWIFNGSGLLTSLGHNLYSPSADNCPTTGNGDLVVPDAYIGSLENNGGPTKTITLLDNSPAIDAVPLTNCKDLNSIPVFQDQRGITRPNIAAANCDIGAFEHEGVDTDSDGQIDLIDTDDDNDGVLDVNDTFPLDATETTDTDGDGIGDNADNALTVADGDVTFLITAINTANNEANNPGLDIIELATGGTYQLTSIEDNSFGNSGLPAITSEIIIKGNGASILGSANNNTCDGSVGDEFRVLLVDAINGNTATLTLNNITVRDGCAFGSDGGGIAVINGGSLNLNNSAVINSAAQTADGVYSDGGRSISISR
jgi:subtilase family protein/cadherin-like protein/Big-like domain-containing protein/FG-GAP repeat protein